MGWSLTNNPLYHNGSIDLTPGFNLGVSQKLNAGGFNSSLSAPSPGANSSFFGSGVSYGGGSVLGDTTPNTQPKDSSGIQTSTPTIQNPDYSNAYSGGGTAAPAINAQAQQAIDIANAALGRLPGQLDTAKQNIQHRYDQNFNELQSGFDSAKQNYGQQTDQNGQQFVTNKNQINDQASGGLRSLLRLLGQHGAGGSSAALYAAPNAVDTLATRERSGAGQTYGDNQQALDTNFNTYQTGYGNSKKQLSDWLTQQNNSAQTTSEQARQNLLQQLAGLQPTTQAAQPYIDQINQSANTVDSLQGFNPTYTGKSPVYTAPDISQYTVDQTGAPTLGAQGNNTGAISPALSYLLGLKDKQQQPTF